jgi:hypothetical protein
VKYLRKRFAEFTGINSNPNAMQTEKVLLTGYEDLIAKTTSAPVELLPILEDLMRNKFFYSTLDWQAAAQLGSAAKRAYRMYLDDAVFYEADRRLRKASFRLLVADGDLRDARISNADTAKMTALERELAEAEREESATRTAWEAILHR